MKLSAVSWRLTGAPRVPIVRGEIKLSSKRRSIASRSETISLKGFQRAWLCWLLYRVRFAILIYSFRSLILEKVSHARSGLDSGVNISFATYTIYPQILEQR